MNAQNDESSSGCSGIKVWENSTDESGRRILPPGYFWVGSAPFELVFSQDLPIGENGEPPFGRTWFKEQLEKLKKP